MTEIIGDEEDTGFVILAGRPSSAHWDNDMVGASDALKKARTLGVANGSFKDVDLQHRRGAFLAFASGVSFGGGQKVRDKILFCKRLFFNKLG